MFEISHQSCLWVSTAICSSAFLSSFCSNCLFVFFFLFFPLFSFSLLSFFLLLLLLLLLLLIFLFLPALVLALVNVSLGMMAIGSPVGAWGVWFALLALLVVTYIAFEFRHHTMVQPVNDRKRSSYGENGAPSDKGNTVSHAV